MQGKRDRRQAPAGATLLVNGATAAKSVRLQNGDVIELGAAKFRFWLAPLGQAGQRKVEIAIWDPWPYCTWPSGADSLVVACCLTGRKTFSVSHLANFSRVSNH